MKNPVIRILVLIICILFFQIQMSTTVTVAISSENWTTGVQEGDLIVLKTIVQVTPFEYQIMSGGSLIQTTDEQDDQTEFLITGITSDTVWFVRKTFDSSSSLKVESDPIPISRSNTDIHVNFYYPNAYDETSGERFFTPVITTNVDELNSTYTGHDEYELILTTDKIIFEYKGSLITFSPHRLEYDRDTGIFRYLEWRHPTGVLASQAIREDLLEEYVHRKCVSCETEQLEEITTSGLEGQALVDRLILIGVILVISIGGFILIPKTIVLWSKNKLSSQVKELLDSMLGVNSAAFILMTIQLDQGTDQQAEYTQEIPSQILEFKFLMNPVRLSICKVLKENVEIASRELRDTLGLSWGDFSTHTTALKKRGFIHSYSKFEDGMEKQYMSLEPEGEKRFSELVELLLDFLDEEY